MLKKQFIYKCFIIFLMLLVATIPVVGASSSTQTKPKTSKPVTENDLQNKINLAKNNIDIATEELKNIKSKNIPWMIFGEIISRTEDGGLIIWGQARPAEDLTNIVPNLPGWQVKKGNIIVLNPDPNAINYYTGTHYYIKDSQGTNALGGIVTIKIYGPLPKAATQEITQKEANLKKAINNLELAIIDLKDFETKSYNPKIQSDPNNAQLYKELVDKLTPLYNLSKQYNFSSQDELLDLVTINYNKYVELNPNSPSDTDQINSLLDTWSEDMKVKDVDKIVTLCSDPCTIGNKSYSTENSKVFFQTVFLAAVGTFQKYELTNRDITIIGNTANITCTENEIHDSNPEQSFSVTFTCVNDSSGWKFTSFNHKR